jgi:hypothetical protein
MAKVVNLQAYKSKVIEDKAFSFWRKRFKDAFNHDTMLSELADATIYLLACPGEESTDAFYEIIIGALDFGTPLHFQYLENEQKMLVVDIHLFLADQTRFEMMKRLGWLSNLPFEFNSIIEIVMNFNHLKNKKESPKLDPSFPNKEAYRNYNSKDREAVIRSMLPKALDAFKTRKRL